jgi:glutathione S-transferase
MGCGGGKALPPAPAPLSLYVWPGSAPCRSVMMVVTAANLQVSIVNVNVMKGEQRSEAFKSMNPDHTVPVLVDQKADKKICDSHAIMPYLLDVYAPDHLLYPADPARRNAIDKWLKFDQEKIYPGITEWVYPQVFRDEPPDDEKFAKVKEVLDELEENLAQNPYLAYRSVSLADLAIAANLSLLELVYYEVTAWKNVWAWLQRIKGLAYYAPCNAGLEKWKLARYVKEQDRQEREARKKARKAEE